MEETKTFTHKGWTVDSSHITKILPSAKAEEWLKQLGVASIPDQVFEDCHLTLKHESGATLEFNAFDALKEARLQEGEEDVLKCRYYDSWKSKSTDDMVTFNSGIHWTYLTKYKGGLTGTKSEKEGGSIDLDLLKDTTQRILFYEAFELFEDDLGDCGVSKLELKFRMMPTCWLILLRQFVRVDRVEVIIRDTRWFSKYDGNIVCHTIERSMPITDMAGPEEAVKAGEGEVPSLKLYNNVDQLANTVPIKAEKIVTYTY